MTLSVITVTHRSRRTAPRYVESFLASGSGRDAAIEFVIVENSGDTDIGDLFQPLRDAGHQLRIAHSDNRGFGAGCNAGAALASNRVLVFANPDVEFVDPIDPVATLAGHWGTVTQINGKGEAQSFDVLPEAKTLAGELRGLYRTMTPPPPEWLDRVVPVGSFFCVDGALFRRAGGFDERIFLYHEEAELARRLHRLAGAPAYLDRVRINHRGFGSQHSSRSTLAHETDGLFAYAAITGEQRILWLRAATLFAMAPLSAAARVRLGLFLRRLSGRPVGHRP